VIGGGKTEGHSLGHQPRGGRRATFWGRKNTEIPLHSTKEKETGSVGERRRRNAGKKWAKTRASFSIEKKEGDSITPAGSSDWHRGGEIQMRNGVNSSGDATTVCKTDREGKEHPPA